MQFCFKKAMNVQFVYFPEGVSLSFRMELLPVKVMAAQSRQHKRGCVSHCASKARRSGVFCRRAGKQCAREVSPDAFESCCNQANSGLLSIIVRIDRAMISVPPRQQLQIAFSAWFTSFLCCAPTGLRNLLLVQVSTLLSPSSCMSWPLPVSR